MHTRICALKICTYILLLIHMLNTICTQYITGFRYAERPKGTAAFRGRAWKEPGYPRFAEASPSSLRPSDVGPVQPPGFPHEHKGSSLSEVWPPLVTTK